MPNYKKRLASLERSFHIADVERDQWAQARALQALSNEHLELLSALAKCVAAKISRPHSPDEEVACYAYRQAFTLARAYPVQVSR